MPKVFEFARKAKIATIENLYREEGGAAIINNSTPGLNKRLNSGRFSVGAKSGLLAISKSPRSNFGTLVSQAQEYPTYGEAAISFISNMLGAKNADHDQGGRTDLSVGVKVGLGKMLEGPREAGGIGGSLGAIMGKGQVIGGAIKSIGGVKFAAASSSQTPKVRDTRRMHGSKFTSSKSVRAYRDLNYAHQIQSFINFTQAATFSQSDMDEAGSDSAPATKLKKWF